MKPKIGKVIYFIYNNGIIKDTVYALGKETFIVESFGSDTVEETWQWSYDDYGTKWFTNLEAAKRKLTYLCIREFLQSKFKIVKIDDGYWELQEK